MKRSFIVQIATTLSLAFCLLFSAALQAQVGIGILTPAPSAQLDVTSTNKGVLVPRMSQTNRDLIGSPATGLLIFQTDNTPGFYYYDGAAWQPIGLAPATTGFSANRTTALNVSSSSQITGFSVADPYIASANFNPTTGNYTVPATGDYQISATVNYSTTAALSISLGAGVNPSFSIRRSSPTTTDLITGNFPILNVNVALVLTLRAILGVGTVTMSGRVHLTAGDVVGLYYNADGLTVNLDLGGGTGTGVVWSVTRVK